MKWPGKRLTSARPLLGTALALAALLTSTLLASALPAAALPGGTARSGASDGPARPVVSLAQGALRGQTRDGAEEFLGVPYAAPPVADARLRPPRLYAPVDRGAGGRPAGSGVPAVLAVRAA